jgi:hypothetical protein
VIPEEQRLKHFEYVHYCIKLNVTVSILLNSFGKKKYQEQVENYIPAINWVDAICWSVQECKI